MQSRLAQASDAEAIACLDVRSWRAAYADLMPAEYLNALDPSERLPMVSAGIQRSRLVVAVDAERIIGYALVGSDRDIHAGALHMLYVEPDFWGVGAGPLLEASGRTMLRDGGHQRAALWVLKDNHRALRFYARRGWEKDGSERPADYGGRSLIALRMQTDLSD